MKQGCSLIEFSFARKIKKSKLTFTKNLMRAEPDRTGAKNKTKESATWS